MVPSSQVRSGRCQRTHQTLRSKVIPHRFYPEFTVSQEYKDVKEKVDQLVPWLRKLKENLAIVTTDVDPEEEKRRDELSK